MDDNYYRKARPKLNWSGWMKKQTRKKSVVFTLLLVVPACSFMLLSNKGILKRVELESEKRKMVDKLEQAKQEQHDLQDQSKALDKDPKAIEKVAREKYGMIRDGETVYKVKKEQ